MLPTLIMIFTMSTARQTGNIRIIAGRWRGRKLPVKDLAGLRPTTDRVKETVFNWLAAYITDARCLDAFAGAGGLGFEAASRRAESVVMVEQQRAAAQQLRANARLLAADNVQVVQQDIVHYLQGNSQLFDVVFLDPPFRQGLLEQTLQQLIDGQWLNEHSLVYIETEKELPLPACIQHWSLVKEKIAGQVSYRLLQPVLS